MRKVLVATLFVGSLLAGGYVLLPSGSAMPGRQILAASAALPAGTLLREQDVVWQTVSATDPDQIVRSATVDLDAQGGVYGAALRKPLDSGEPIRRNAIVKPGDREFLQVVLPAESRAIAIPVSTGGAGTGLLSPGDRVDVILTQNFKDDLRTALTRRSVSETIAQNVRVLVVDAQKPAAGTTPGTFGRTVTLEVTPRQAERINVAVELGKLTLTLRNLSTATAPSQPVEPTWAGDVSPALFGAAQEKPTALKPTTIQVIHGDKQQVVNQE
jgi:pilus assembly protein CpaB